MSHNGIPIVGQSVVTVRPQQRANARDNVGKMLEATKALGVRHCRLLLPCALNTTTLDYILHLDAIVEAGCRVVSINEHLIPDGQGSAHLQCHVLVALPEALVTPGAPDA